MLFVGFKPAGSRRLVRDEEVNLEMDSHLGRAVSHDCNEDDIENQEDDAADFVKDERGKVLAKASLSY